MVKRFADERAAQKWARDGRKGLATVATQVDAALDAYELHLEAKGNKSSSIDTTMHRLHGYLRPVYQVELVLLHPARCRQLYADLVGKQAADTHRNTLAEARTFFRWCIRQHWLGANPLDGVEGQERRKAGKAQLRVDESRKLYDALLRDLTKPGKRPGAMAVLCALVLGMRASEIVGLQVRDVDDGGALLWVAAEGGKTDAARRRVLVPPDLVTGLNALAKGREPDEPLLGTHWRDWPREVTQRYCDHLGLPQVTAHGLRGTSATMAYEAGQAGLAVAALLGHTSETVTRRHYAAKGAPEAAARQRAVSVLTERRPIASSKRHPARRTEKRKGRNP